MRVAFAVAGSAMLATACALQPYSGLRQGSSVESDVRKAMGEPAAELRAADGSRSLAYPKGPLGTQTFMVRLNRDGVLERLEQVLTDDHFHRIQAGRTSAEEVRALIGPPWRTMRFENLRQDAWDYHYRDTWGYLANFSVMIDERGMVASKAIVRIDSARGLAQILF